jgi:hypothetical protein
MNFFHIYIFLLKILVIVQLFLIFFKKEDPNDPVFVWSDYTFNTSLALFLMLYFFFTKVPNMDTTDRYFFVFIGFVYLFNTWKDELFKLQSYVYTLMFKQN